MPDPLRSLNPFRAPAPPSDAISSRDPRRLRGPLDLLVRIFFVLDLVFLITLRFGEWISLASFYFSVLDLEQMHLLWTIWQEFAWLILFTAIGLACVVLNVQLIQGRPVPRFAGAVVALLTAEVLLTSLQGFGIAGAQRHFVGTGLPPAAVRAGWHALYITTILLLLRSRNLSKTHR